MTSAEHDRGDHRAGDLGQVEQADVKRAVAVGQQARGQRGRRHRGGRREQRDHDARDRHRAGEHRCGSSAAGAWRGTGRRSARRSVASPPSSGTNVRRHRGTGWVSSSDAPKNAATRARALPARSPVGHAARLRSAGGASSKVSSGQRKRAGREIAGDDPEQRPPGVRLRLECRRSSGRARPRRRCTCS